MYSMIFSDGARIITKRNLRQATIDKLIARKEQDIGYFVKFITSNAAQKQMGQYLEALKNRTKKG